MPTPNFYATKSFSKVGLYALHITLWNRTQVYHRNLIRTLTPDRRRVMWWYPSSWTKALTVLPSLTLSMTALKGLPPMRSTSWRGVSVSHTMLRTWVAGESPDQTPFPAVFADSWASSSAASEELSLTLARPSATSLTATFSAFSGSVEPIWREKTDGSCRGFFGDFLN